MTRWDWLGGILITTGILLVLVDRLTPASGLLWAAVVDLIAGVIIMVIGRTHTPT